MVNRSSSVRTDQPTILKAYQSTSKQWETSANVEKLDVSYSERESDVDQEQPGISRYVLVGFTLRFLSTLAPEYKEMHKPQRKRMYVGGQLTAIIRVPNDQLPVMIVAQLRETESAGAALYALINMECGLCTPYAVA